MNTIDDRADRQLKQALFACIDASLKPRAYGGVLVEDGRQAWVHFSVGGPPVEKGRYDRVVQLLKAAQEVSGYYLSMEVNAEIDAIVKGSEH